MDVRIREAAVSDYDGLCALFEEVDALHVANLPHIFRRPDGRIREREYVLGLIVDEDVGLFVAEVEAQPAGLVCAILRESPDIPILVPRRYAVIDNLVVSKAFRRRGIGRALMGRAQQWALAQGADSVELTVWGFNQRAVEFYRHLGFETVSHRMAKQVAATDRRPTSRTGNGNRDGGYG